MIISAHQRVDMLELCLLIMLIQKLLRMSTFSLITSIVEDTLVNLSTSIIDEVYVSSDSTSNDVNEIVGSNIPVVPSKSFEFLVLIISLWSFLLS